jgi:hypothetical protein
LITGAAGSGLDAGFGADVSEAAVDESAPGAVAVDEHETIPKPMEASRIPVNTFFIEILLRYS